MAGRIRPGVGGTGLRGRPLIDHAGLRVRAPKVTRSDPDACAMKSAPSPPASRHDLAARSLRRRKCSRDSATPDPQFCVCCRESTFGPSSRDKPLRDAGPLSCCGVAGWAMRVFGTTKQKSGTSGPGSGFMHDRRQHPRAEVAGRAGQEQEPGVVGEQMQPVELHGEAPADPPVARGALRRSAPSRRSPATHRGSGAPASRPETGVSLKLVNVSEHSPDGEARHWSDRTPWRDTIVREVSMRTRSVGSARASVE